MLNIAHYYHFYKDFQQDIYYTLMLKTLKYVLINESKIKAGTKIKQDEKLH